MYVKRLAKYYVIFSLTLNLMVQEQQGLLADLYPGDGAGGGVHLPVPQCRGHQGPGGLLPGGAQEEVQICHRSAGLQGARYSVWLL